MQNERPAPPDVVLRTASPADAAFVAALSAGSFARLGDYGPVMAGWFAHPGCIAHVAELAGRPVGFVMLAFVEGPWDLAPVADIIGIAVDPAARGQGIGRRLLRLAITDALRLGPLVGASRVALSVAADNAEARALFAAEGFVHRPREDGRYPGGQPYQRMILEEKQWLTPSSCCPETASGRRSPTPPSG